ncbi:hypothetical protein FIBSPDRAFT_961249 [Athelia psychrophila]|uniref:Uncharacterized protein n=1 Tax=Athelia psychrophila TaxID=1759441 RepID=A0A166BDQ7_9AGAM|nr:hypothetical protein FIBSPDRAFT_961249 [Fibularhizoctonia sp. CBS 109695]
MVPNSPVVHIHLHQYPHIFVDSHSSNIPVSASSPGVTRGSGIDHQYAIYLDSESDDENDAIGSTFNLAAILESLASCYPKVNFQQYEGKLCGHGIMYLDIAARFEASWYTDPAKAGMLDGEAALFRE